MYLGKIDEILCVQAKVVAHDLKTSFAAQTEEDAQLAPTGFNDICGQEYPLIAQSWLNNGNGTHNFF